MPKAIVVAVGDTPLNPLNDLLKQNSISSKVIDATTSSMDEIDKLIQADDQGQCVLLKGISSLSQHIPRIADATEKLVLLYCSPATALANALETSNGKVKPEQVINRWQESVSQAMAMVEESELYSLCDLNDVLEHSSLFLKDFFAINKAAEFKPSTYTKKQFANHLATLHLFEQDDAFALYDEALSIGKLFGEFTVHLGPDTDEIKQSGAESGQSVFKQLISNHQEIQSKHNEIESLKAQSSEKVNALEKQIAELQHTKAAFEENSIQLQEELTKNKQLAEQQASKIEALQDSKHNIETKLQAVSAQIEKSQNEMTALASELSDKEASLTENQERLTNIQSQLQGKEQRNTRLQSQIEELKASSTKLNEELRHQKQVIAESDKDKAAKSAALQELENKLQSVNQQVSELNSEKIELTDTVQQLNEQLVNQHSVNKEKEQECKATKSSLQETQQQLQAAKTSVTELKAQQDELTSTIEELKQQLANQQSIIEEKDKECKATKSSLQETQQQLQAAKTNVTKLKAQQDELTSTIEELKKQLANQQSVNEEKEKECKATKKSLQETQQQLQAAKSNVTELKAQQGELTSKIEQLEEQIQSQQIVIEEKQEAITLKDSAIKEYENQLNTSHQKISQLETNLVELQTQHKEVISGKDKEFAALSNSLTQAQTALEASTNSLVKLKEENTVTSQEFELATIQVAQLQEELESTFAELQRARAAEALHEETRSKLSTVTQQIEQLVQDKELAELQISQLQEELESTFAELLQARATEALHEETRSKLSAVTQQIEQLVQDKKLAELKISQLQEELKLITVEKADLEAASSLNENVIAEKTQQIELLTQANEELTAQSSSLKQQVEAATKRKGLEEQALVNELQAQLEQQLKQTQLLENNNARLQEQLKQSEAGMSQNNEFQQAELELASLQISQLQEELEYYYNAWQEAQQNGTQVIKMGKHHQKVFTKAQAESLVVTGKYSEDGYQDAHFMLNNVLLGDGRHFAELPVKLVRVGEHVAIELRDKSDGSLFQHFEDSVDEYGPFLRIFHQPSESKLVEQQVTFSRINASDRVLVMSVIGLLAELIQAPNINCEITLTSSEWRTWRLSATQLAEQIDDMPIWLSFDSVSLKEEYQTEGYEHLWLSFENVLVGDSWKELVEVKVAASGINKGKGTFCDAISLEFREMEDQTAPLLTWPPETIDEHGPKYTVALSDVDNLAGVARADQLLILHLVNNLPEIINKMTENTELVRRSKKDWADATQALLKGSKETSYSDNYDVYSLKEVISMGSYQHLLFSNYDNSTDVKLKAENINPDTFDAEVYLEFRNGNERVIGNSTEFYGDDEFGPRVLVPLEVLLTEPQLDSPNELEWAVQYLGNIENKLTTFQDLDELVKRLWTNILSRKKELVGDETINL